MQTVTVDLDDRSYPIFIGANLLENADLLLPHIGSGRVVIVTNEIVAPIYLERVQLQFGQQFGSAIVLPDGEATKNLDTIGQIYDHLLQGKYDRKTTLVALGGGVGWRYNRICSSHFSTWCEFFTNTDDFISAS